MYTIADVQDSYRIQEQTSHDGVEKDIWEDLG
jgi:hypothetical protein